MSKCTSFIVFLLVSFFLVFGCTAATLAENKSVDVKSVTSTEIVGYNNGSQGDVMIQGFVWQSSNGYNGQKWWDVLKSTSQAVADAKFDMIWFPPCSDSGDDQGYLPREWYKFDSRYGTTAQLSDAIRAYRNKGVKVIADVVINHRVGTDNEWDFTNPDFFTDPYPNDDHKAIVSNDDCHCGTGAADTGRGYDSARDLDHTNATVRSVIKSYVSQLRTDIDPTSDIALFDGFRYDMVVGYSPGYVGEYNFECNPQPYFSVGEYMEENLDELKDWINKTNPYGEARSALFDFANRSGLLYAITNGKYSALNPNSSGKAPGLIGDDYYKKYAVTFFENHDTEESRNGANRPAFPNDQNLKAYTYILTHPGIPCVFWSDWWANQADINAMIAIRKETGIGRDSTVNIDRATDGQGYSAYIGSNVAMMIGSSWTPSGSVWTLRRGNPSWGWAIWTKS